MSSRPFDPTLYLVTDPDLGGNRPLAEIVRDAIAGGVTCVQFRDKRAPTRELIEQAKTIAEICKQSGVSFLVNDRIDVALAIEADGVHIGQDDMPLPIARRLMGPEAIIGVSVRSSEQVAEAVRQGATYVAANGIWATSTKTDFGEPLGVERVQALVRSSHLPLVGIGGIHADNANELRLAGCAGIAVVSAIIAARSPKEAAAKLKRAFLSTTN